MKVGVIIAVLISLFVGASEKENHPTYTLTTLASNLAYPKAMIQLPDKRWLITLRDGELVFVDTMGNVTRSTLDIPQLYTEGQGGVLDVELATDFSSSKNVFFSYSKGNKEQNYLAVVRATLSNSGTSFSETTPIFAVNAMKDTPVHYGGKLLALENQQWLLTSGDGFDYREQAQLLTSQLGKVLRFSSTGQASTSAPFPQAPYVYTYGHRNPQGLIALPSGILLLHEHGPDGGDEVNQLMVGSNYGWPVVTLGKDYSGASISPFDHYPGMVDPIVDWTPSIAPSAMAYYAHNAFPSLQNHVLVTALKGRALYALDVSSAPIEQKRVFPRVNKRLRDVAVGDEGDVYLLVDGKKGQLIRVSAK
jgi:glucose/arabinose dehydrogenase